MATVTLELPGGRSFEIAAFRFGDLERAAPHVDRLNELVEKSQDEAKASRQRAVDRGDLDPDKKAVPTVTTGFALMGESLEIIAIGAQRHDPALSAEALRDMVEIGHLPALQEAAMAILSISGLGSKGEAKAPSRRAKGASRSSGK